VIDYDKTFDNDLYEYFIREEPTLFWKCWHNKFSRVASSNRPLHAVPTTGGVEADCPQFESGGNIFQVTGKTLTLAMRGMPPPIRGGGEWKALFTCRWLAK
jgi:hypothetical protein